MNITEIIKQIAPLVLPLIPGGLPLQLAEAGLTTVLPMLLSLLERKPNETDGQYALRLNAEVARLRAEREDLHKRWGSL